MKKLLFQFLRRQLVLSKGDRGEVFQLRPRQVLRRGSLPDLALHSIAEQGVRYLILLHFSNFVSVYFADTQGTIVNVKNFDRKRDQNTLEELPRLARRILEYPRKKKVPAKHDRLLQKAEELHHQFRTTVHGIEKLIGVRLSPKKIPGIALTEQEQEGVIQIPSQLRTQEQLDRFFTIEAFRLFIPTPFHPHANLLARILTYLWVDDPVDRTELVTQFPEAITQRVSHLPPEGTLRLMIRPLVAVFRLWARYDDRALPPNAVHCFLEHVMAEFSRIPTRNLMEVAATTSEVLFHRQGDARDLLRMTCFLVLSENHALIREYHNSKIFQQQDDIARFCYGILTLRLRQFYLGKHQIIEQFSSPKLSRLVTRAFEQLQTWILQVEHATDHLTLVNQSDLDLIDVILRRPGSDPEDVVTIVPQLVSDSAIDIHIDQNLISEQLIAEFSDNFGNRYQVPI